ncbi:MAG TPA: hypothetical protein DCQ06_01290 [Myxococcales bacterium]|nr:hypothetical protein [Myxococcales bacterium]HAN30206.1 hypothetical protein [Myxococcales bacterium]
MSLQFRSLCKRTLVMLLIGSFGLVSTAHGSEPNSADEEVSFFGARTIAKGRTALWLTAGLPDVEIGALYGLSTLSDVSPTVRFNYGRGLRIGGGGLTAAARFRMKFAETHGWTIAVSGSPGLSLHMSADDHPPSSKAGAHSVVLSPLVGSLSADKLLTPALRLVLGIEAGIGFFLVPERLIHTPVQAQIGVELHLTKSLFLLARADLGVDMYSQYSAGQADRSKFLARFRVGLAWLR